MNSKMPGSVAYTQHAIETAAPVARLTCGLSGTTTRFDPEWTNCWAVLADTMALGGPTDQMGAVIVPAFPDPVASNARPPALSASGHHPTKPTASGSLALSD